MAYGLIEPKKVERDEGWFIVTPTFSKPDIPMHSRRNGGAVGMSSWYESAKTHIAKVISDLPADATFEQKKKAISAAYPWGERRRWPYKMWLKAQKEALFGTTKTVHGIPENYLSPLERLMRNKK